MIIGPHSTIRTDSCCCTNTRPGAHLLLWRRWQLGLSGCFFPQRHIIEQQCGSAIADTLTQSSPSTGGTVVVESLSTAIADAMVVSHTIADTDPWVEKHSTG